MKYFKNKQNELFVDPIVENHVGLEELTKEEFDAQLAENNIPTAEQVQAEFRATRNTLLSEVDIEINIAVDAGLDVAELRAYRQALRDSTQLWVMPEPIVDAGNLQSAIWNEGRPL